MHLGLLFYHATNQPQIQTFLPILAVSRLLNLIVPYYAKLSGRLINVMQRLDILTKLVDKVHFEVNISLIDHCCTSEKPLNKKHRETSSPQEITRIPSLEPMFPSAI